VPGRFFIERCGESGVARRNFVLGFRHHAAPSGVEGAQDVAVGFRGRRGRQQERVLEAKASERDAEISTHGVPSSCEPDYIYNGRRRGAGHAFQGGIELMPRQVVGGLIQARAPLTDPSTPIEQIREAAIDRHIPLIEEAGRRGVQILGLQEVFNGPYFCPSQDAYWYDLAEPVPGPTTERMATYAKRYGMAMVVPVYEREQAGVYYNTAAVYDADGSYLGKYRKNHIPHTSGFWEKYFFKPGNLGYPVFRTRFATIGVYICYDRHFPEGARLLGLNGAEIVFNPSATVAGLSQYLWKLEQPAHAVANGYFMACSNRVGTEAPWNIGHFYGSSYFVDPRGNFLATGSEDQDELVVAEMDLDMIEQVRRVWQFYRDRRPDSYGPLAEPRP
jgi:beta-ureidopropionase